MASHATPSYFLEKPAKARKKATRFTANWVTDYPPHDSITAPANNGSIFGRRRHAARRCQQHACYIKSDTLSLV